MALRPPFPVDASLTNRFDPGPEVIWSTANVVISGRIDRRKPICWTNKLCCSITTSVVAFLKTGGIPRRSFPPPSSTADLFCAPPEDFMPKTTRAIMRIDLTPASKELFCGIADRQGMTQLAVTSRLVEWFCQQPEAVQHAILQSMHKGNGGAVAKMALSRMSA
jgi:hypothetical protein